MFKKFGFFESDWLIQDLKVYNILAADLSAEGCRSRH